MKAAEDIPIYFLQRPFHRRRQRDTVEHLPPGFRAVTPNVRHVADHEANVRARTGVRGLVSSGFVAGPMPLNVAIVRDHQAPACELLYTWGKVPLWPRSPPYVVELDNPYVLTLYHDVEKHERLVPVLRRLLLSSRCAGIVCISEACRRTLRLVHGEDVAAKARVVYPYVDDGRRSRPGRRDGPLHAVMVGTQFWLKGGRELCDAVELLTEQRVPVRLTVVSRTPPAMRQRYSRAPIRFIDATISREHIVEEILRNADVFVLPTGQESFGMAALEALSAGLPIVATDVYALSEIVEHQLNGILLDDPVGIWRDDRAVATLWGRDMDAYVRDRPSRRLQDQLAVALRRLSIDHDLVARMAQASSDLYAHRFAPSVRTAAFRSALEEFI